MQADGIFHASLDNLKDVKHGNGYVCMYVYMYEIEDPGQSGGPVSPAALGRSPQAVLTDSPLRLRMQVCMYV